MNIQGEKAAAEKLADFLLSEPKGALRTWRLFGRVKTGIGCRTAFGQGPPSVHRGPVDGLSVDASGKKSPEDAYVVGIAEIAGEHADVRFQVIVGTKPSADFLIEYTLTGGERVLRTWHAFCRAKTEEEATRFLLQMRQDYDRMVAQRQAIASAFNSAIARGSATRSGGRPAGGSSPQVRSTRRC